MRFAEDLSDPDVCLYNLTFVARYIASGDDISTL
jgi:hypothetical protein